MTISEAPKFRRYSAEDRAQMLVQAGLACLAEGGITSFTIDNICRRAEASRGLVAHHFGSKDGLLAAVYEAAYQPMLAVIQPQTPLPLGALLDALFDAESHSPENLRIWLALWGEVAVNPDLRAAHRRNYRTYRDVVELAIEEHCFARSLKIDAGALATTVIGLIDGLWLEQCIDPDGFDATHARAACRGLLTPLLGAMEGGEDA